ncbi:MAG: hypothetical protein JWQ43_3805 [Glaciihabitans sp.]|nr:hypothetical protein [Glaciihabitans sp.]
MTISAITETERKYDVDETLQLPALAGLGAAVAAEPVTLRAVYFDTADGRLAARAMTLRRRTGGKDAGWHLKFPGDAGRTEYGVPLVPEPKNAKPTARHDPFGTGEPPAEIRNLVRAVIRDEALIEVARLTTRRTVLTVTVAPHTLHKTGTKISKKRKKGSKNGEASTRAAALDIEPQVEIADDVVSATDVHTGILRVWREWEAELLSGAPEDESTRTALLDAVEERLLAAGASPSVSASKLARATGRTSLLAGAAASPPDGTPGPADKASTALQVVSPVLADLVTRLVEADPHVRLDEPDSVHQMRTLVRRLRSVLAAFGNVLREDATDPVRQGLNRLGDVLGTVRDTEVRRMRAVTLLENDEPAEPGADVLRASALLHRRLVDDALGEYGAHLGELYDYLDSAEYFALLDDLELLVSRPPVTESALLRARKVLKKVLETQGKRATKKLAAATSPGSDGIDLGALHEARKASRRLRHVAEALTDSAHPVFGKKVAALGDAAEAVQDVIGEHRDSVLFLEHLLDTAVEASKAGEDTVGYGVLSERERVNAAATLGQLDDVVASLRAATER